MAQSNKFTGVVTHKTLASRLRGMTASELKSMASAINQLGASGFKPDDIFPLGVVISDVDGAEVRGHVSEADLATVIGALPALKPRSITIFPRGIVVPDDYRVHVKLDRQG